MPSRQSPDDHMLKLNSIRQRQSLEPHHSKSNHNHHNYHVAQYTHRPLSAAGQHHTGQWDADGQLVGLHCAEWNADRQAGDSLPMAAVGTLLHTLSTDGHAQLQTHYRSHPQDMGWLRMLPTLSVSETCHPGLPGLPNSSPSLYIQWRPNPLGPTLDPPSNWLNPTPAHKHPNPKDTELPMGG